mmetsp:Transcript_87022/g.259585  ORF Transcript_87022/g.259585 Transcript_87022/m.259585 type:complete len:280 (-) Transcript_87022:45-884(-)
MLERRNGPVAHGLEVLLVFSIVGLCSGLRPVVHAVQPDTASSAPATECGCPSSACTYRFQGCVSAKRRRAALNCGGRCDVVFFGDSIVERMTGRTCFSMLNVSASGTAYMEAYGNSHPGTLVLGGACDQTQQGLYVLDSLLPMLRSPAVFFVLIGTNNIPRGGRAHALRGIAAIVQRLLSTCPTSKVLLHAVLPRWDDKGRAHFQDSIDALNRDLVALVRSLQTLGSPIEFLDCSGAIGMPTAAPSHFDEVGLHPSPSGYRALLACLGPRIDQAIAGRI